MSRHHNRVPVAWWLVPSGEEAAQLARCIEVLAARVDGPLFEPHLTLGLSELPADWVEVRAPEDSPLARCLAGVATRGARPVWPRPLRLPVKGFGHTGRYFQAFFLMLGDGLAGERRLQAIRDVLSRDIEAAVDGDARRMPDIARQTLHVRAAPFAPHLSLCYGELSEACRTALVATTPVPYEAITFDTLVGVRPRAGVANFSRNASEKSHRTLDFSGKRLVFHRWADEWSTIAAQPDG